MVAESSKLGEIPAIRGLEIGGLRLVVERALRIQMSEGRLIEHRVRAHQTAVHAAHHSVMDAIREPPR